MEITERTDQLQADDKLTADEKAMKLTRAARPINRRKRRGKGGAPLRGHVSNSLPGFNS
jgi:hypothetical protein